ncbi:alkaline-phosphatase-like protein [Lipomyces mesembrius]
MYTPLIFLALATTALGYPSVKPQGPIGGATPEPLEGLWTPPSHVYSNGQYKQVVFLSFDGMHQSDLVKYIEMFPNSTWASLMKNSIVFNNAKASSPSDSFPATTALFTGATPRLSGIYWDDTWAKDLYPASSNCTGPMGAEVDWSVASDYNSSSLTGGNAFNLSAVAMKLNSWGVCQPIFPHDYLRVNTIFEVARANGLNTAYFDKHPSYEFVNGPSGLGLTQGYFPEIGAVAANLPAIMAWDDLHWSALSNVTAGHYVNGTGTIDFSIIGANFQGVTWAQSNGGGYACGSTLANPIFGKNLTTAFKAVDAKLGVFIKQLKAAGKLESTLLILGSKQGQSPVDESTLTHVDPQKVINATGVEVSFMTGDDAALIWLKNGFDAVTAKTNLLAQAKALNIQSVLAGDEVWEYGFGNPRFDPRAPDIVIYAKDGTLFSTNTQTENHGAWVPDDLEVPLVLYNPTFTHTNISLEVKTTQIATTILSALGLPLAQLDGWRSEGTPVLPYLGLPNH